MATYLNLMRIRLLYEHYGPFYSEIWSFMPLELNVWTCWLISSCGNFGEASYTVVMLPNSRQQHLENGIMNFEHIIMHNCECKCVTSPIFVVLNYLPFCLNSELET